MAFQDKTGEIHWKMHFSSSIQNVYNALTSDDGRKKFWAESAEEKDGFIEFKFFNYPTYHGRIIDKQAPGLFRLDYFETEVTFTLTETDDGGTDLSLLAKVEDEELRQEMISGWVSALMAMKAAVDFDVDLRNHNAKRTWDNGFVDN